MDTVRIIGGRSGRVWPPVLRAAEESRSAGRAFILYIPEQYTLQAERDLITGLGLPGLLDIQVVSLHVHHNGQAFVDAEMDVDEFYKHIGEMVDNIPSSSQPTFTSSSRSKALIV